MIRNFSEGGSRGGFFGFLKAAIATDEKVVEETI